MRKRKKPSSGNDVTFEFGNTDASKAFFQRHPNFLLIFERMMVLGNKSLAQRPQPKNHLEDICFGLAHTCREDFVEILFLCVNGYGNAGLKLLRGLFERAVALEFIIRNPEKADRFLNYAAIQEHRGLQAALKLVSEEDFDKWMGSPQTVAEIKARYEKVKPEFQVTLCKTCKTTRTASNWDDMDLASMLHKFGDPYKQLYLMGYALPNFSIHATLASASRYGANDDSPDFVLLNAMWAFVLVLISHNKQFNLQLNSELDGFWNEIEDWYVQQQSTKRVP